MVSRSDGHGDGGALVVPPRVSGRVVQSSVPNGAASRITLWNVTVVLNESDIERVGASAAVTSVRSIVRPSRWYDESACSAPA